MTSWYRGTPEDSTNRQAPKEIPQIPPSAQGTPLEQDLSKFTIKPSRANKLGLSAHEMAQELESALRTHRVEPILVPSGEIPRSTDNPYLNSMQRLCEADLEPAAWEAFKQSTPMVCLSGCTLEYYTESFCRLLTRDIQSEAWPAYLTLAESLKPYVNADYNVAALLADFLPP
ncbi:MAG: hypothetical protein KDD62_05685, partial [Bdellovibrionales bacterium]|nr:hypothetical protein [Bdellovibrionales bacterium]